MLRLAQQIRVGDGHHALVEDLAAVRQDAAGHLAQVEGVPAVAGGRRQLVAVNGDLHGGLGAIRQELRRPGRRVGHILGVDVRGLFHDAVDGLGLQVVIGVHGAVRHRHGAQVGDRHGAPVQLLGGVALGCGGGGGAHRAIEPGAQILIVADELQGVHVAGQPPLRRGGGGQGQEVKRPGGGGEVVGKIIPVTLSRQLPQELGQPGVVDAAALPAAGILHGAQLPVYVGLIGEQLRQVACHGAAVIVIPHPPHVVAQGVDGVAQGDGGVPVMVALQGRGPVQAQGSPGGVELHPVVHGGHGILAGEGHGGGAGVGQLELAAQGRRAQPRRLVEGGVQQPRGSACYSHLPCTSTTTLQAVSAVKEKVLLPGWARSSSGLASDRQPSRETLPARMRR